MARTASALLFRNPCRRACTGGTLRIRSGGSSALVRFPNRRRQARVAVPRALLPAGELRIRWRVDDDGAYNSAAYRTVLRR